MFPEIIDTRPLRRAVDDGLNWVVRNWGGGFEAAAHPLLMLLKSIENLLIATPWWIIVAILVAVAWLSTRNWKLPAVVFGALIFLGVMDLWDDAMTTMALMIAATLTAIVIAIPVGVWMSRSLNVRKAFTPILDLMQTLPSFVYLIPTVMIFGPGKIPALIATIVYASPPLVRLTDLGLRSVDPAVMEASRAFGTNPRQRLLGV
ncbi:MAG: ABC transporter permease subunit, partial [Alphaproteobacteria bacterium]|nr:ABC transporter permease subunit [Alphaproteobacteria bacterium]